jgi:hypothetical protein
MGTVEEFSIASTYGCVSVTGLEKMALRLMLPLTVSIDTATLASAAPLGIESVPARYTLQFTVVETPVVEVDDTAEKKSNPFTVRLEGAGYH